MAHTISLRCFSPDFSSSSSIDINLIKDVVARHDNLKLENESDRTTLQVLKEDNNQWLPLLWISTDDAYINSKPIFDFDLYYDLVDIAESTNACITTEEGLLLFIPGYGLIYDPDENEDLELEIGELNEEIRKTENLALSIKNIFSRKEQSNKRRQEQNRKRQENINGQQQLIAKFESKQHYIAIAVFAILVLLLLIKKIS